MKNYSLQKHLIRLAAALALAVSAVHAQAQNATVTFDFSQLTKGVATDTITGSDGTTTLTLTTSFGVLAPTSPAHVPAELEVADGVNNDMITFTFSKAVTLQTYTTSTVSVAGDWEGDESLTLNNGVSTVTEPIPTNIANTTTYDFTNKVNIADGNNLILTFLNPGAYTADVMAWSRMTVTVVPEPASYALLLGFGAFLFIMIRHRIRR